MTEQRDGAVAIVATRLGRLQVRTYGAGPPAILWHSLFVDSKTWTRVRDPLAQSRRLVLVDGPGHGASASPSREFTLEDCAGAAVDLLDQLGVEQPVDWVGNAWGGHVGALFAAAHPERCRSLVTIGTPVHGLSPAERRRYRALVALYRRIGPVRPLVSVVCNALLGPRFAETDPQGHRLVTDALRHADRRGMYLVMRSVMLNRSDLSPRLPDVAAPTLFAAGADDPTWTPADARAAARLLPRGTSATLAGGGHVAPLLEAAPAVVDLLAGFWTSCENG